MNSPAIALALRGATPLLWARRVRGLLKGLAYATALSALLVLSWAAPDFFVNLVAGDPLAGWQAFLPSLGHIALAVMPGAVLAVLGVNLAPRAGVRRVGGLAAAAFLMVLWAEVCNGGPAWNREELAGFGEGLLSAILTVSVVAYHVQARGAADVLMRTRIAQATLEAELQRAHLQLLRAQIEPHFLFNTLSSVRALARTDRAGAVQMLDNLIRYFQAQLRQDTVPLAQEMQLLDAYLAIYRMRMGARLSYEIVLPPGLEPLPVPAMMLLTLVENALKHGVGPAVEGGAIRISASADSRHLVLKVADSGRGLSAHQGHGNGLANLRQRLSILYGPQALLTLAGAEPRGVVASIRLPLR